MSLVRSGWTLTGCIKPDSRCRITWKKKEATWRPQRLSKSSCRHLLSWLHTEGLPQLWLCPNPKYGPQVSLVVTFASGSEAISAKIYWPFLPEGQSHPSLKGDLWSSVCSHAPPCFSNGKWVSHTEREAVGAERAVGSPLTPNTSLSCQYNESWESCWPRIRCQGEVAGGEKCQEYCFPAGSGNSLCLCPSALRSKPPWIIQVSFENSHRAASEGSLALPAGKQALIVSSRAKPRFLCSHDSCSCHIYGRSSLFLLHQVLTYRTQMCGPSVLTGFSRYFASNWAHPCSPALMHWHCFPQSSGHREIGALKNNYWETHLYGVEWFRLYQWEEHLFQPRRIK